MLTTYQRKGLERWQAMRATGPTWNQLLRWHAPQWLMFLAGLGLLSMVLSEAWGMFLGMFLGMWARDIAGIRSTRAFWPALSQCIAWERVDAALEKPNAG